MDKRILVFFPHKPKPNFGGAYTYLYNLQAFFSSQKVELHFLHQLISLPEESIEADGTNSLFKRYVKRFLPLKVVHSIKVVRYLQQMYNDPFLAALHNIDFAHYDAIHFHETVDLWRSFPLLKNYKGKIILTSHSPKPYHLELLEDVWGLQRKSLLAKVYQKLEEIDKVSFSRADVLVAPCEEAALSYKEIWPQFNLLNKSINWYYIPTGIDTAPLQKDASVIRKILGIGEDAFVVVFNGRHLPVKGFDLLVAAAEKLLESLPDLFILVTGKANQPPAVNHKRWLETGWTATPQDYINAGNLVIVPNRNTYFDLGVLLSLSLGKPVLLSNTGGNRYFHQFTSGGIVYLPDLEVETIESSVTALYHQKEVLIEQDQKLKNLFNSQFSMSLFASRYEQFYLSL